MNLRGYKHASALHGAGKYARGECHVNSLESHWSLFKRSVRGTYIHVSKKTHAESLIGVRFPAQHAENAGKNVQSFNGFVAALTDCLSKALNRSLPFGCKSDGSRLRLLV